MTDPNTMTGDRLSTAKPMVDGAGAHLAEQVGIEAERLGGTMKDGVEAVQEASKTYGNLFMDAYARMIQVAMRNGQEMCDHVLALLQAKTPADAFKINVDFMQRRMSNLSGRLLEMILVGDAPTASRQSEPRASCPLPKIVLDGSGQQGGSATDPKAPGARIIQA